MQLSLDRHNLDFVVVSDVSADRSLAHIDASHAGRQGFSHSIMQSVFQCLPVQLTGLGKQYSICIQEFNDDNDNHFKSEFYSDATNVPMS